MKLTLRDVKVKISPETVDAAVGAAVVDVLRSDPAFKELIGALMADEPTLVAMLGQSPAFKDAIEVAVRAEVRAQAPGNPRLATVIKEVQEHLDRYPSIAHDVGLQNAVGKAIFDYMQKTL